MKKYLQKQLDEIIGILEKGRKEFTENDYHDLRVAIKKLRAVYSLLSFRDKDAKPPKSFSSLNIVFKKAGKVRSLQIEKGLLHKYRTGHSDEYVAELENELDKAEKKFFRLTGDKNIRKGIANANRELPHIFSEIHPRDIQRYLARGRKKLGRQFEKYGEDEDKLHKVRKKLKSYYYILELDQHNKIRESIDVLQTALGKWHDLKTSVAHLAGAVEEAALTPHETTRLKGVITRLEKQKKNAFGVVQGAIQSVNLDKKSSVRE